MPIGTYKWTACEASQTVQLGKWEMGVFFEFAGRKKKIPMEFSGSNRIRCRSSLFSELSYLKGPKKLDF